MTYLHDIQQKPKWYRELRMLWNQFDPIGVIDRNSEHWQDDDEYEAYVLGIMELLSKGASKKEISGHVYSLCNEHISISTSLESCDQFTEDCLNWYINISKK